MFGLVGGVLADTIDRRKLLIVVQTCMVIAGAMLTILTILDRMPPALLLTFTFLLGAGSAFSVPAYSALIPDLVRMAAAGNETERRRLMGAALGQTLLWFGAASLFSFVFAAPLVDLLAPGISHAQATSAVEMLRIVSPSILLLGLASLAGAMLNA